jgi:hypothetical protein
MGNPRIEVDFNNIRNRPYPQFRSDANQDFAGSRWLPKGPADSAVNRWFGPDQCVISIAAPE